MGLKKILFSQILNQIWKTMYSCLYYLLMVFSPFFSFGWVKAELNICRKTFLKIQKLGFRGKNTWQLGRTILGSLIPIWGKLLKISFRRWEWEWWGKLRLLEKDSNLSRSIVLFLFLWSSIGTPWRLKSSRRFLYSAVGRIGGPSLLCCSACGPCGSG